MSPLVKIRISLLLIFILLYTLVFVVTTKDKEERIQYILEQKIKELDVNYRISNNYFENISNNAFTLIINRPDILELLYLAKHTNAPQELEKIRTKLYDKLKPYYTQLSKSGVIIMLFSFENNHTFLRVHKPSKFGDDLSRVRYSFSYVNKHKKPIRGFEQGKISHAFRNIFPIFYRDEYLGSVDIAFSSESLQEGMTTMHGIDTHFILNKDLFDANIWKANKTVNYIQSIEHEDYLFALTQTHTQEGDNHLTKALPSALTKSIQKNITHQQAFSLYHEIDDTLKIISFSPIKNIKNETTVAYLVSYIQSPYLKSILRDYIWINISVLTGMLIILLLVHNIIQHRLFLQKEVDEKTQELKALNENLQQDIQKQLNEIRQKDGLLLEQARLASLGEMIGNIAHQWRQPLNALGLVLQKIPLLYERNKLDEKNLQTTVEKGMGLVGQMSTTIDDFRYFFRENRKTDTFKLVDIVNNTHALLSATLENEKITLHTMMDEHIFIDGYANELSQVLLNIINNAKDALQENSTENGQIHVSARRSDLDVIIDISDNAGGISENIIHKIFEPYFSTKEEGKGTGIGLFMSKRIVEEHMQGQLTVSNSKEGAKFTITLPQTCPV